MKDSNVKYAYPYPSSRGGNHYGGGPPVMAPAPQYGAPPPARSPGFLEACLATLCCCCLLDCCGEKSYSCGGLSVQSGNRVQQKCEFQMPFHYPQYKKENYLKMEEWKLDLLLHQYGLPYQGTLWEKRNSPLEPSFGLLTMMGI